MTGVAAASDGPGSGAGTTAAEHLDRVTDVGEPVLGGDLGGPLFDDIGLHLHGGAALATDQVVMVIARRAMPVHRFPRIGPQHVDLTSVGQCLQVAVHRCQSDGLSGGFELIVKVLRGPEFLAAGE